MVILGVDPGLNATGYGVLDVESRQLRVVTAGTIRPPRRQPLPRRLEHLHQGLTAVASQYQPVIMVLETVFTHQRYPNTAALLAHARGVACLVAQEQHLTLAEYAPARIKQAVTGTGSASKAQVARMVEQWVGMRDPLWSADATDALALAIAHAHREHVQLMSGAVK